MIARIHPPSKSFKSPISYLETGKDGLARPEDRVAWREFWNLPTRNSEVSACMMAASANASVSKTQLPAYLFSVSLDPDDPADEPMLRRIAARTIRDMGLQEYEVVVFCHKDRSHPHLHFVVNRVHPERRTLWSPWRDYYRIEKSLRAQEKEFGLRVVPPPPRDVGRSGPGQEGRAPRLQRGDAAFVTAVTERATPVLEQARSWAELIRGLAEHGLSIRVKGGGIVLSDARQEVKASQVGRAFSRERLEKRFGSYPDYRARMAVANAISPVGRAVLPTREQPQAPPAETIPSPAPELSAPAPEPPAPMPAPQPHVRSGRRPQFGDAGHGISELFGQGQAPGPAVERAPAPQQEQPFREVAPATELDVQPRQAPILRADPVAPRLPSSPAADHPPLDARHLTSDRPRLQFGDAGHGIAELFGYGEAPAPERAAPAQEQTAPAAERASARPQPPERRDTAFLLDVQKRATPVLRRAKSWAELERGLSEQGLSLRVSGGGFRVTDGLQEVKASDVGRAFSRFHLEKRLGLYPAPAPTIEPEAPARSAEAAVLPQAPAKQQPQQLALPLPAPTVQEPQPSRTPPAPPREDRLVAPISPAWRIVGLPPELPPATPSLEAPTPIQPEPPRDLVELPETADPIQPLPPPPMTVEPVRPTEAPARKVGPTEPQRPTVRPRQRIVPRRTRTAPATERDNYREVVWSFRQKLAELYRDPRAARRAFDVELGRHGAESAVGVLAETPERYGKLRILARRERVVATVPWAELYADWQRGSIRPDRYAAADLLEAAALPFWISDARAQVHAARHEYETLPKRIAAAAAVEARYTDGLKMVYADPAAAERLIDAHCQLHGVRAAVKAIEESPRLFGALRPNEDQSWLSRQWNGRDTSAARERAKVLAEEFRAAQVAVRERPQPDALLRARTAVVDAERFAEALEAKIAALPHQNFTVYAAEALRVIDQAAAATGRSVDRIVGQVRPMLSTEAIRFAGKALDAVVRQQEREQRNYGRESRGFDI